MAIFRHIHVLSIVVIASATQETFSVESEAMMQFEKVTRSWAESVLLSSEHAPSLSSMVSSLSSQMPLDYAARQVEKQNLPEDVAMIVRDTRTRQTPAGGVPPGGFDSDSLSKARNVLNDLAEGSWRELDDHLVDCQEFYERNRDSHDQVVTDINRLIEQLTDLERLETEAVNGIQMKNMEIKQLEEEMKKEQMNYEIIYGQNSAEMTIRQNDLDVFNFILTYTKCGNFPGSFLQKQSKYEHTLCVCPRKDSSEHVLVFKDKSIQQRYHKVYSKSSAHARKVIDDVFTHKRASLIQSVPISTTVPATAIVPVEGEDRPAGFGDVDDACDCSKTGGCDDLHDEMSLLWGQYKDSVDELRMEMNRNQYNWFELKWSLNSQIQILVQSKTRFMQQLAEVRSNMAADRSEKKEKEFQRLELDGQYSRTHTKCTIQIKDDCQKYCQYLIVRNAVMDTTPDDPCHTSEISDCDVDNWVPEECSVPCDDSCDHSVDGGAGLMGCGGWQEIQRKIVVKNNTCGVECPPLVRWKRCNQIKCPVDCVLSEWTGFSSCTAECEGGVRGRTRSLMTKPKSGGLACNSVEEEESCNTMSCDRDCFLAGWTSWSPCSMACGGGWQDQVKHVLIPIRGNGKCPAEMSADRYNKKQCNTHNCNGDEICIAVQDLVIAVDGSGSISDSGYNYIKSFTRTLIGKYKSQYREEARMRIGLVSFGNGDLLEDGTVSPAVLLSGLTAELGTENGGLLSVVDSEMTYHKGFTNMAQAFALSEKVFIMGSNPPRTSRVQQSIVVISDGLPSFAFQTNELVEQLDDKGVMRYFVVVNDNIDDARLDLIKSWASQPWESNVIHVPGLVQLSADSDMWAQKAISMFCPMAISPDQMIVTEQTRGHMLVADSNTCGARGALLSNMVNDASQCAYLAQGAGVHAFWLGVWFRRGYCYASPVTVDSTKYRSFQDNRMSPPCDEGWQRNPLFDFYAVAPVA